jgi:hypothetical protein
MDLMDVVKAMDGARKKMIERMDGETKMKYESINKKDKSYLN